MNTKEFKLIDENIINQTCLFHEKPIVLNRGLAMIFGDADTALLFQQLHYWINLNKEYAQSNKSNIETYHEGRFWCFQTYEEWNKEFSWLSYNSVRRKMKKLEDLGVVISGNFNKLKLDRTKWYTIDYKRLLELQNQTLHKKYQEKEAKEKIRKEKKKKIAQKTKDNKKNKRENNVDNYVDNVLKQCGNPIKNTNLFLNLRSAQNGQMASAQNGHFEVPKMGAPIQEINKQEINYIQEINKVSLSVLEDNKKETRERQTDYNQNLNNDFEIELDNCDNELKKVIISIINKLLKQKTITMSNKKIKINSLILELKKMNKQTINKLIDYVVKKFEISNNDNIKNKNKYISVIFVNAIFEKEYMLDNFENTNQSSNYIYGKNKFINYNQKAFDFDMLKKIQLEQLKKEIEK